MPLSVALVLISFLLLFVAIVVKRIHRLHLLLMSLVMLFDLLFPVWLYLTHDWIKRLIDHGEILSFAIWAHLFLVFSLYALYVLQIQAGIRLMKGDESIRPSHRLQGRGVVIARIFVLISGILLIAPD